MKALLLLTILATGLAACEQYGGGNTASGGAGAYSQSDDGGGYGY